MRLLLSAVCIAALGGLAAQAQEPPATVDDVAQPGDALQGAPELALVQVATGFLDPTNVTSARDGTGRIFVTERAGRIKIVNKDGTVNEEPFLDLTAINPLGTDVQTGFVEQGLYSVTFHPNFKENGYFYVHYASLPFNGDGMIVRFTVDPENPDTMDADRVNETAKVIMRIEQPWYNHNGGQIEFGPDGMLYIASGDGGWEGDPLEAGQDLSTLLGKMLRIDVDVEDDSQPYAIPPDNPFAGASRERLMTLFGISELEFSKIKVKSRPEIWSYGLRNPYEFSFDPETGNMFVAEVGQNHWEEIIFEKAGDGGRNYGWPLMEAAFCFPMTGDPAEQDCPVVGTLPAAMYPHNIPWPGAEETDSGNGCSVQGLGVANYGGMKGVYLAGDWCSGRLFGLGADDNGKWQFKELMQTSLQFTAGGYDEDNMVLAVNANNFYLSDTGPDENPPGTLWRIMPASDVPEGAVTAEVVKQ